MTPQSLTKKLIELARTMAGWATELNKLNQENRIKVAKYLEKVADTHERASHAIVHLSDDPSNKEQRRCVELELGRIKGYVDTVVDVLSGHLDGRKLAGVKRRINGVETDLRIAERGSNSNASVLSQLHESEGYFRAIADSLHAPPSSTMVG